MQERVDIANAVRDEKLEVLRRELGGDRRALWLATVCPAAEVHFFVVRVDMGRCSLRIRSRVSHPSCMVERVLAWLDDEWLQGGSRNSAALPLWLSLVRALVFAFLPVGPHPDDVLAEVDGEECSLLELAAACGRRDSLSVLLYCGADVNRVSFS